MRGLHGELLRSNAWRLKPSPFEIKISATSSGANRGLNGQPSLRVLTTLAAVSEMRPAQSVRYVTGPYLFQGYPHPPIL